MDPNFFLDPKAFFSIQIFFYPKTFFGQKYIFDPKIFSTKQFFFNLKFFSHNSSNLNQFWLSLAQLSPSLFPISTKPLLNRYWNKKWNYSFCLKTYDKKPSITKYFPFLLTIPKLFVTGNGIIQTGNRNNSAFSCPWIIKLFLQNMSNF